MREQFILVLLFYMMLMGAFFVINELIIAPKVTPRVKATIDRRWNISIMVGLVMIYFIYGRNGP